MSAESPRVFVVDDDASVLRSLLKPFTTEGLLGAVERALAGDRVARQKQSERAVVRERFSTLTRWEWQVCQYVARGMLNKQIAAELGTAEQTVRLQRSRAMTKLSVTSVAELVRLMAHLESGS